MHDVNDNNDEEYQKIRLKLIEATNERSVPVLQSLDQVFRVQYLRVDFVILPEVPNVPKAGIERSEYVQSHEGGEHYPERGSLEMLQDQVHVGSAQQG